MSTQYMRDECLDNELMHNEKKLITLSERLVYALTTLHVTQAELARRVGIKPQAINYLCSSNSKKSSFTYEIADALKINSLWLGHGEGAMRSEDDPNTRLINSQKRVPLLDWKQIKHWAYQKKLAENVLVPTKEWVLTNSDTGENGFAFKLLDKSMYPRFEQDTIVIMNIKKPPKSKDFVLIYLKEIDDIVFRQYEVENTVVLLKPTNTAMYKVLIKNDEDSIIGVMVEARWQA